MNPACSIVRYGLTVNPELKFIKTHPDAQLPTASNKETGTGDTGYDLTAVEDVYIMTGSSNIVPVGLTLGHIDSGFWFRIEPRSGLGFKHSLQPHLGVIDNGYRGDLGVKLFNFSTEPYQVKKGDRVAQLVVYPLLQPRCSWVEEASDSSRGDSGFGSTGK